MSAFLEDVSSWYPAAATSSLSSATAAPADGVDRISALPDDILREVISRLPVRDGARTAALANRWRGLWRSTPLVLRDSDLLLESTLEDNAARDAAFAAVGRILADHPGPFRKVQLTCCEFGSRERELVEWVRLLAAKDVQDLVLLDVDDAAGELVHSLPADILSCTSLQRLFLSYWKFPYTSSDVIFPHLKKLGMQFTNMMDEDLDHMLACCPVLQVLALCLSKIPQRIHLHSQSLQCMLLWMYMAGELAVVDASCLQRLILWMTCNERESGDRPMLVKIHRAPKLRVLGYLEPRVHQLQIGNIVINDKTKESPSSIVPSVKILALKVNFCASKEVNMLPSFLRCFPNVETLHIESSIIGVATGSHHAKFWREVLPVECLKSHVKKIVIHNFRVDRNEFEFLKFIAKGARKLQDLVLVLTKEISASEHQVAAVNIQLALRICSWPWAEGFKMTLMGTTDDHAPAFLRASNLSDKAAAFTAVGRILADHRGPFRKVHLTCCEFGSRQRELVQWARLLAAKGVQELLLFDVDDPAQPRVQPLPADILSCASLQYLTLGCWRFPCTSCWRFPCTSTDVVFPYLKKLSMQHTNMRDEDLDHMLSCSPVLEILALILSQFPGRIRLRSQSLKCMLLWMYFAEEVAVVDAPCLQRLILWMAWAGNLRDDHRPLMVKIHRAPNLSVLGFLEPSVHQLQIGNIVINAETKASPSSIVPSVKTLALKLCFDAFDEVKMLPSFLRCFPNVETLHIESSILSEATARPHAKFWLEVLPIECLKSHIKKIVIHKFRGGRNEFEFLRFIANGARKLQDLVLVMPKEISASFSGSVG
ncbi:hypothetical protein EJB05_16230, partial [Eragrostis curvula]